MGPSLTGVVGLLRWHFYPAASINDYTVTRATDGSGLWYLRATVVLANGFNINQSPLTFIAKHAKGEWRFPVLSREYTSGIGPGPITATMGEPESYTV